MTHPTDEELDALVERQTRAANKRDEFEALMNADRTVRAITALRAQLAEAQAERDDAMALFHASEKAWKARADRAEAERAEQHAVALEPDPVTLADALKVPEVRALVGLMPEVIASLDATGCNVSLTSDLRAALRAIGEGEA